MPNRLIKDSIHTSKSINALSDFQFRVWVHLITYVDDYGRGIADPEIIKGMCFPRRKGITDGQIAKALDSLANADIVRLYEVDGEPYLYFPNWDKHQQVRAKKSKHPAPEDKNNTPDSNGNQMQSDDSTCPRNPIQSNTIQNPIQSESNTTTARARASSSLDDPDLGEVMREYEKRLGDFLSTMGASELINYYELFGKDVVLHALDVAVDAKTVSWTYIKGILRNYSQAGVKCMDDVLQQEAAFEKSKNRAAANPDGTDRLAWVDKVEYT